MQSYKNKSKNSKYHNGKFRTVAKDWNQLRNRLSKTAS